MLLPYLWFPQSLAGDEVDAPYLFSLSQSIAKASAVHRGCGDFEVRNPQTWETSDQKDMVARRNLRKPDTHIRNFPEYPNVSPRDRQARPSEKSVERCSMDIGTQQVLPVPLRVPVWSDQFLVVDLPELLQMQCVQAPLGGASHKDQDEPREKPESLRLVH
jgi:hypothetical protein